MFYFLFAVVFIYAVFSLWFAITSLRERYIRAGILGMALFLAMAASLTLYYHSWEAGLLSGVFAQSAQIILALLLILFTISMFIPLGRNPDALSGTEGMVEGKPERFNQKDTAFNIAHVGGYGAEVGRQRWALQSKDPFGGIYWTLVMALRGQVDGKVNPEKRTNFSKDEITQEIKKIALYAGADLVGICRVKDDFTYSDSFSYEESKLEVGPAVTTPIDMKGQYVIVLAKEMDYDKINTTLTDKNEENLGEVGKAYYEIAQIACALAAYIRQCGYSARAHHLRNEQIFQVPHAIDAGLGEQGRFNYLITKKYGPRVRLASVTTELELNIDRPVDIGIQDFCEHCRLCEINCPSQAVASEKSVVRGYRKWPQDQEKCFTFWVTGANTFACSQCLKVCPWNKPTSFVHRVGFYAAARSVVARRVLYWVTVLFYGRRVRWKMVPHRGETELPSETDSWSR